MFIYVSQKWITGSLYIKNDLRMAVFHNLFKTSIPLFLPSFLKITMSLIQRIRDRAAWIVFGAIALALLAFIVQDAFYRKGSGLTGNGSTVGKINGESIGHDEFEHKVSFYEQMGNGQYQRSQLIGQVWDYLINQTVVSQETEKLGITVTGTEKTDLLFGSNPPQFMQQYFTDPKTGVYDVNTAKKQIGNLKTKASDPQVQNFNEAYIEPLWLQTAAEKY